MIKVEPRPPPPTAVEWIAIHRVDGTVLRLLRPIVAQLWFEARQEAARELGVEPESLEVTRKF